MTSKCDGSQLPESLTVEVHPRWPFKLPRGSGRDGTATTRAGVLHRLLHVGGRPVVVRAWQPGRWQVILRADAVDPGAVAYPPVAGWPAPAEPAAREQLERAIERMRFALGVDEDLSEFRERVRGDRLLEPLIRRFPYLRPRRRPWPWEALAWAVTQQLIESPRAAAIQRRIVRRWGPRLGDGRLAIRDVPAAAVIAGRAPAELASMDLSQGRGEAMIRSAREVASGRADLDGAMGASAESRRAEAVADRATV
jgi:3-methyladenine DNA glycosylase/8-oxoguanine DNA glycosylase